MTDEKLFYRRFSLLLGFFLLCLTCFTFILYDAQIVNGKDYLARSTVQVTKTETVETFRGPITDRNGKLLVSNQEIYTVTFEPDLIPDVEGVARSETVARALLRLLRLCQDQGVAWTDGLPVSLEPPFAYTFSDISTTQRNRFQNYLLDRKWSDTELPAASTHPLMSASLRQSCQLEGSSILTADQLIELMRDGKTGFGIPEDFSNEEARLVLGVLYELRLRKLGGNLATTVPYVLAEDISVEMISLLNDGRFSGAVVSSRSERQYHTDNAAHILGRVGSIDSQEERAALNAPWTAAKEAGEDTSAYRYYRNDDKVGKEGVEKAFETWLAGRDGSRLITTNQDGKITSEIYSIEPEPGGAVALTIDIDFQAEVEAILAQSVQEMNENDERKGGEPAEENTRGAAAAVISVSDSSILALGTYPTYSQRTYLEDYADLSQDLRHPYTNRAIAGAYAPGSTFKPLTAAAALESGIITSTTKINTLGSWTYPGDPNSHANCWLYNSSRGRHGRIDVTQAITVSCNYFFAEMGYQLGMDRLNEYCKAFGLGVPTGIELWERTGTLPENQPGEDQAPWAGFGQSSQSFTPLQLANYIATLLRGGVRYDAHLLKDVSAYDGSGILYTHEPQVLSDVGLSEANLAAIKKGMGNLVSGGTLTRYFQDCVVTAGAKTGSAQLGNDMTNGVFVCFAPYEEPEIAVAVVIERGGSGAAVASTAVNILNAYFAPSEIGVITAPEGTLLP
ncbi:MAG: penicillin-binding protein A [Oscillospiraceae bacterium]|nr:penicillin-binding protein A [Oscillospiraceae bacterium]